jgi:hypothetical protein
LIEAASMASYLDELMLNPNANTIIPKGLRLVSSTPANTSVDDSFVEAVAGTLEFALRGNPVLSAEGRCAALWSIFTRVNVRMHADVGA